MQPFTLSESEKDQLERLGVEALILFGSQVQEVANAKSDYNFGVLVKDYKILESPKQKKEIQDLLNGLLSSKIDKLVEIVFLEGVPLDLQMDISEFGVPVYENNIHAFPNFRAKTMLLYADFAPIREMFKQADEERRLLNL